MEYKATFNKAQGVLVELVEYEIDWTDNETHLPELQEDHQNVYFYFEYFGTVDEVETEAKMMYGDYVFAPPEI